jgi:hypothetical protein
MCLNSNVIEIRLENLQQNEHSNHFIIIKFRHTFDLLSVLSIENSEMFTFMLVDILFSLFNEI